MSINPGSAWGFADTSAGDQRQKRGGSTTQTMGFRRQLLRSGQPESAPSVCCFSEGWNRSRRLHAKLRRPPNILILTNLTHSNGVAAVGGSKRPRPNGRDRTLGEGASRPIRSRPGGRQLPFVPLLFSLPRCSRPKPRKSGVLHFVSPLRVLGLCAPCHSGGVGTGNVIEDRHACGASNRERRLDFRQISSAVSGEGAYSTHVRRSFPNGKQMGFRVSAKGAMSIL